MFNVYPINDVAIVKGEGSWVWDDKGNKYLDMYGGHAVISVGHTNPAYVKAITDQINQLGFYSNSVIIKLQKTLAEKLGQLSGKEDYQLFMCNSGAEANENALKLASFHNGRKKVVAFKGAFHGRTSLAVSCTDNPAIIAPVNGTPNVTFLPYNDVEALKAHFAKEGEQISSVIVEGIQGVGGIRVASKEFLRAIREQCDKYGAVYIADAIQCGCGRTGGYYSQDYAGVNADIYSMAKGLANGFPIGAIAICPNIAPKYGMLGTTFGGNHLACAGAIAIADIIREEKLMENAANIGDYLISQLKTIDGITEVRGRGLMIGIEFPFETAELRKKLLFDKKIFVGASGKTIIRLLPALNITREHADIFLQALRELLAENN